MKKLFLAIMISPMFIGCNSDSENTKLNKGLKFEAIKKKKGFDFENKNNYPLNNTKESDSNKSDLHKGCVAPCCAE